MTDGVDSRWSWVCCALGLMALACGVDEPGGERRGAARHALVTTCPDGQRPTLTAPAVGLSASKSYGPGKHDESSIDDERCLTSGIDFVVPSSLRIAEGDAGKGRAYLSFRNPVSGAVRECEYRGTSKHKEPSSRFDLKRCSDGSAGGAQRSSDYFRLRIESAEPAAEVTRVALLLGTPDPQAPVEVSSTDDRIADARLVVPEGAATPFEHFALEVVDDTEPALPLNYGVKSGDTIGYGVSVLAPDRADGTLAPSPSGETFELELPFDPQAVSTPGGTLDDVFVLEVARILPWSVPEILGVRRDISVDTARGIVTLEAHRAVGYIPMVKQGTRRIPYNGGPVMKGQVPVHFLYYGTLTTDERALLEEFVANLGASSWLHIVDSYNDTSASLPTTNVVMGQTIDVASPNLTPKDSGGQDQSNWVWNVVNDALGRRQLPLDGNAMYFVVAGSDVSVPVEGNGGWHSSVWGLPTIKYGLIKNPSQIAGFPWGNPTGGSPNNLPTADAMVNILAHEIVETLVDPEPLSGWAVEVGVSDVENADNCAFIYGDTYKVGATPAPGPKDIVANVRVGARDYLVQQNWVNIGGGFGYCAVRIETDDARVSSIVTTLPDPPAGQDYRPMIYGATYDADITLENIGDTAWRDQGATGEQYLLGAQSPQDNTLFGGRIGPGSATVPPGTSHHFAFSFDPTQMFPGADYFFQWRMVREAVRWFGESTPPIRVRALFDLASLDGADVPAAESSAPYTIQVTFTNASGAAWRTRDGYFLSVASPSASVSTRVELAPDESVEPGASKTFDITFTAPEQPGSYALTAGMNHDGVGAFGPVLDTSFEVVPTDRATFVSQELPAAMNMGSPATFRATFRNTGTSNWQPGFRLSAGSGFITSGGVLDHAVPVGDSVELVATATPSGWPLLPPFVAGITVSLLNASGRLLASGPLTTVQIDPELETLAQCVSTDAPAQMTAGETYHVRQTMKNVGDVLWTTDYRLASVPPERSWGAEPMALASSVAKGESYTFEFDVTAPEPGTYPWPFMMHKSAAAGSYFFDACPVSVEVLGRAGVCKPGDTRVDEYQSAPRPSGDWDWDCSGAIDPEPPTGNRAATTCDAAGCYYPPSEPYRYCSPELPQSDCLARPLLWYFDVDGEPNAQCGNLRHELFCAWNAGNGICSPRNEEFFPAPIQRCK